MAFIAPQLLASSTRLSSSAHGARCGLRPHAPLACRPTRLVLQERDAIASQLQTAKFVADARVTELTESHKDELGLLREEIRHLRDQLDTVTAELQVAQAQPPLAAEPATSRAATADQVETLPVPDCAAAADPRPPAPISAAGGDRAPPGGPDEHPLSSGDARAPLVPPGPPRRRYAPSSSVAYYRAENSRLKQLLGELTSENVSLALRMSTMKSRVAAASQSAIRPPPPPTPRAAGRPQLITQAPSAEEDSIGMVSLSSQIEAMAQLDKAPAQQRTEPRAASPSLSLDSSEPASPRAPQLESLAADDAVGAAGAPTR